VHYHKPGRHGVAGLCLQKIATKRLLVNRPSI
jgi:hypothetical protein